MKCIDCVHLDEENRCHGFPMDFHVGDPYEEFDDCDSYKSKEIENVA